MTDTTKLAQWLGDVDSFITDHWMKAPWHHSQSEDARNELQLLSLEDVDELLATRKLRYPDVRVVEQLQPSELRSYTRLESDGVGTGSVLIDPTALAEVVARGGSFIMQDLHRLWPPIIQIAAQFEALVGQPCEAYAFVTPAGAQALPPHTDPTDGLICQTVGCKRWHVWARTADPAKDAPALDVTLHPGDAVYVPRHHPHAAIAGQAPSVHVTLAVRGTSWAEGLGSLVTRLASVEASLCDLVPTDPGELATAIGPRVRALADYLVELEPEQLAAWLVPLVPATASPQPPTVAVAAQLHRVDDTSRIVWVRGDVHTRQDGSMGVSLPDRELRLPASTRAALERLATGDETLVACLPGLDAGGRLVLARRLAREGVVRRI
jgi:lysine-specific demethylase/histidyl-hydroxylase NO66